MPGVSGAERLNCRSQNNSQKINKREHAFLIFADLATCSPHCSLLRLTKPCLVLATAVPVSPDVRLWSPKLEIDHIYGKIFSGKS